MRYATSNHLEFLFYNIDSIRGINAGYIGL